MALNPGDSISSPLTTYTIASVVSVQGAFANSYFAMDRSGTTVFFKEYKEPSVLFTPWFQGFRTYQDEVIVRLRKPKVAQFVGQVLEAFVADDTYFQVHEYHPGTNLGDTIRAERKLANSEKHSVAMTRACRFAFSLHQVHEAGVIHCDLKPGNVFVCTVSGVPTVRIIDFDWSILVGRPRLPWGAPMGTPWYRSPEHLTGEAITKASDVYTCGLIVCEMLLEVHPIKARCPARVIADTELAALERKIQAELRSGSIQDLNPSVPLSSSIQETLWAALDLDPANRPTAQELHGVLLGGAAPAAARGARNLCLRDVNAGLYVCYTVEDFKKGRFRLTRERCRLLPGAKFISVYQANLIPSRDFKVWYVAPPSGGHKPTNATMVNGLLVQDNVRLQQGDHLQVGGPSGLVIDWVVEYV